MGNYGYICNECGKNIRGEELAHLIHVRDGKILGECEGHYNGYGGVDEDSVFDKWDFPDSHTNINGHDEVMKSCFDLPTSKDARETRVFNGKEVNYGQLSDILLLDILQKSCSCKGEGEGKGEKKEGNDEKRDINFYRKIDAVWKKLPLAVRYTPVTSGVVAYHADCYHTLKRKGQVSLTPSESDPDQSWGRPRKQYCLKNGWEV